MFYVSKSIFVFRTGRFKDDSLEQQATSTQDTR